VEDFAAIGKLVRTHQADTVVVGLPLNMDGSSGFQAQRVEHYAAELKDALVEMDLCVQLVMWDERLTTEQAEQALIDGGHRWQERKGRIDAVAAAIILQSYLDRNGDPTLGVQGGKS
jgi:putative Holliday junction resolvase